MIEFNKENFPSIKEACENKKQIKFSVPLDITPFSAGGAPQQWTLYPPCILPPDGYAQVFAHAGSCAQGALITLELLIHLDCGKIEYKADGATKVALKVTWPDAVN